MKVVLDTNVVVSGIYFKGNPSKVLAAFGAGRFKLVVSPPIVEEYRRVAEELGVEYPGDACSVLDLVVTHAELIEPMMPEKSICRDPDDDKFLACAAATGAIMVTGDKDLLTISGALGVEVVTPRVFISRLEG